jgi:hypothetical protein
MALFAREKEAFLRQFLQREHGLPGHATPERSVSNALDALHS